jgi:hypothetical protein
MPSTETGQPYRKVIEYKGVARWLSPDVPFSQDSEARPFGPGSLLPQAGPMPRVGSAGGFEAGPETAAAKPVLYIPVKRQNGQETIPSLRVWLEFREVGRLSNIQALAHVGAKVSFSVWNVWGNQRRGPVKLEGSLDEVGTCSVPIPAATVKSWLDPRAELRGRVNEILLDFEFAIPDLTDQLIVGESITRIYLYRRKVLVFLPGVFGSQVNVRTPDGHTRGFPDLYTGFTLERALADSLLPGAGLAQQLATQKLGSLECDAAGRPLIQPVKPALFSLRGQVYDVYDDCRAARARYFADLPADFRLIELQLFAYDWRTDLLEAAQALATRVAKLQAELREKPDTDDEVALTGHSTGGLIMRRALGEPGMQQRVSHAFFISVPFRGAPKALGVILTGKDPPGGGPGNRMVDFVDPDSLRDAALCMPIVYHLAPSAAYTERVAFTPGRPPAAPISVEEDKRDLIDTAISAGFLPAPCFVKASGLSDGERALLASSSNDWHSFWSEASERLRAQELYDASYPHGYPERDSWFPGEIRARGLEAQAAARVRGGWNLELAARARQFHEQSEQVARSGAWKDKAYVFYSIAKQPTTLSVHFERVSETDFADSLALLKDEGIPVLQFLDGDVVPARTEEEREIADERGEHHSVPAPVVHQWLRVNGRCKRIVWRLWAESKTSGGDGTVPEESLRGFGGDVQDQQIGKIGDKFTHLDTPNEATVWNSIMQMLQGTWTKTKSPGSVSAEPNAAKRTGMP